MIHLILDNCISYKNGVIRAWLREHGVRLHFLPPYCQNEIQMSRASGLI